MREVRFWITVIGNPVVAIDLANQEITRMTDLALQMLTRYGMLLPTI